MTVQTAVPLLIAVVALIGAWFSPRIVDPASAVRILTFSVVLTTVATATLLLQTALAGLSEVPLIADAVGWCRVLYGGQHGATPVIGLVASVLFGAMIWRLYAYTRKVRAERTTFSSVDGIVIVDADLPTAFAVPGNPGGVVITRSMLAVLDTVERRAVLAHENAHLRYHHHAYVHAVSGCARALPFLTPLAQLASFLTERWADEIAADRIDSRTTVADTIAKVALLPDATIPSFAQPLAGGDVVARFQALEEPRATTRRPLTVVIWTITITALLATSVQIHHLVDFLSHPR